MRDNDSEKRSNKASDHKKISSTLSLEDEHTAEEIPFLGMGPISERIGGYMYNTDALRVIMANCGWNWGQLDVLDDLEAKGISGKRGDALPRLQTRSKASRYSGAAPADVGY